MGVRDTMRGLGCMAKGVGCLLAIGGVILLVYFLWLALIMGAFHVVEFFDVHREILIIAVVVVLIAIVLAIANAIGKDVD